MMTDQATREAAADLIDGGIDVIHERGWCQHVLTDEAGRVCLVEALDRVAMQGGFLQLGTAYAAIGAQASTVDIVGFNNAPERTVEDVVLTMKRAAHSLRDGAL